MESTFNQRFKSILKYYDLSPTDAARKIGTTRQIIDGYLRSVMPRVDMVALILKAFPDIDIKWLIMSEGSMLINNLMVAEPGSEYRKPADIDTIREFWINDREELSRIREINIKLTQELISIKKNCGESKAVG